VARCLIVGCGCRGLELAAELRRRGHPVRGTTRDPARFEVIEAAGVEGVLADPDRLATLVGALEHVAVVVLLLASATGGVEPVAALHGPRLEALLHKLLDTTVRGVVYEAAGTVDPSTLSAGAALVRVVCEGSRIPYGLIDVAPEEDGYEAWLERAVSAVGSVLAGT
jgi:uncharacterized protein YbjT (DUF2867 family)